jgi:antitoxin ParD1/3/4
MNLPQNPELEQLIHDFLATGRYNSASEVVSEGLRLLRQRDKLNELKLEELRKEIQKGVELARDGKLRDGREVFAELREKARRASSNA